MDLAAISGIIGILAALISVFWMIRTTIKLNRTVAKYEPVIEQVGEVVSMFRFGQDEDGAPMMDERLATVFSMVSSGIAKSLKMSLLGAMSGPARLDKGLKGALAADIIDNKMPLLNLAGEFLGFNTKKYISKHPEAIGQLMQMAGPYLKPLMGQMRPNNGAPQLTQNSRAGIG